MRYEPNEAYRQCYGNDQVIKFVYHAVILNIFKSRKNLSINFFLLLTLKVYQRFLL